ncbi:MAG: response regulator transcription factor [Pseudomonadota bacterium]
MTDYRLIVADDHPLVRDALTKTLSESYPDGQVDNAGSLDEVVQVLDRDNPPDLILLDLKMPGVQGFSGLSYLRAQYPEIPVAVISATDDHAVIRRAISFGASGYIPKSVPVEDMRAAVDEILSGEVWVPEAVDLSSEVALTGQ